MLLYKKMIFTYFAYMLTCGRLCPFVIGFVYVSDNRSEEKHSQVLWIHIWKKFTWISEESTSYYQVSCLFEYAMLAVNYFLNWLGSNLAKMCIFGKNYIWIFMVYNTIIITLICLGISEKNCGCPYANMDMLGELNLKRKCKHSNAL